MIIKFIHELLLNRQAIKLISHSAIFLFFPVHSNFKQLLIHVTSLCPTHLYILIHQLKLLK